MKSKQIFSFLKAVAANNNRQWFAEHKEEYQQTKADFEQAVDCLISRIAEFDPAVAHLTSRDCCYRFYRDVRFSSDKSPYKRHYGAYICEAGRKSLRAGYYLHLQPGQSFVCGGAYYLPTNILTACRNEIMANIDEWRKMVEAKPFVDLFGTPGCGTLTDDGPSDKGFGIVHLKTCPKDFPRDYEFMHYLRMKDYAFWHRLDDKFFSKADWMDQVLQMFRLAMPVNHFLNSVIADYE